VPLNTLLELSANTTAPLHWSDTVSVVRVGDLSALSDALRRERFDVVVLRDMTAQVLVEVLGACPAPVVVVAEQPTLADGIAAMKAGAADYTAPADAERVCLEAAQRRRAPDQPLTQRLIEREQQLAVGRLAAGVAHEINNPAAFVVANLNELSIAGRSIEALMRAALPLAFRGASEEENGALRQLMKSAQHPGIFDDIRAMVEESLEGMSRIRDIVHNLRGFSIVDEEPVVIDLPSVARTALDLVRPEMRYLAKMEVDFQPTPHVFAPRSRVSQVLLSMLLNALQAFDDPRRGERGRLRVTSRTSDSGGSVLTIEDNGRPLPEALLQNPDDPFALPYQEDNGVSLRTATSRGILRRLGGEMLIRSDARGTAITITLPPHAPEPVDLAAEADDVDPLLAASVMIIDNEEPIVRSMRRLLRRAKEIRTATNGEAALEVLLSASPPDLILCDIVMPGWSGVELYNHVISERPALTDRFLFITGGAVTRATEKFCEANKSRVMDKPFEPEELRERIREMLRALRRSG